VAWLQSEREQREMSRKELARRIWPNSAETATTSQIKRYETVVRDELGRPTQVTLPAPDTLRKIARELQLSWLDAFARAGYYHEILEALAALVALAKVWLDEDKAFESDAVSFRSIGVTMLGGRIVWDALDDPYYAARYIMGTYVEQPPERVVDFVPPPEMDEETAKQMRSFLEAQGQQPRPWHYVVPKPMALAILVVASGFPRRGDVWKAGADTYASRLLASATALVNIAEQQVGKVRLAGNLLRADEVLKDAQLALDSRRVIAAEHLIRWADDVCQGYTHYARLASMDLFGVAGSTTLNFTPEAWLPQIRVATLPDVEQFHNLTP
jgi:hypothetical protein